MSSARMCSPTDSIVFSKPAQCYLSKAGYVTRHRVPLGGRKRLHHVHHFGIVGPLTFGIAAHRLDQIFIPLAGQPRRRQPTTQVLPMTSPSYTPDAPRPPGASATRPRRPV